MREIQASDITQTVSRLCVEATRYLPDDVLVALQQAETREASPVGKRILGKILENAQIARTQSLPAGFQTSQAAAGSFAQLFIYDLGLDYFTHVAERVNAVTATLFESYRKAEDFARAHPGGALGRPPRPSREPLADHRLSPERERTRPLRGRGQGEVDGRPREGLKVHHPALPAMWRRHRPAEDGGLRRPASHRARGRRPRR